MNKHTFQLLLWRFSESLQGVKYIMTNSKRTTSLTSPR